MEILIPKSLSVRLMSGTETVFNENPYSKLIVSVRFGPFRFDSRAEPKPFLVKILIPKSFSVRTTR